MCGTVPSSHRPCMTRLKSGMALLVCGALALAACGGDDDDVAKAAANGGGNPAKASVPSLPSGGGGGSSKVPDNPCTVVPKDLVDAIVPGGRVDGPRKQGGGGVSQAHCGWVNDLVTLNLDYTGGVPHDQILMSINGDAQDYHGDKVKVAGDDAAVWSVIPGDLEIGTVHDDVLVTVHITVLQAQGVQYRDRMLAVAEAAVGAL
jgi:hypothetical protein